MSKQKQADSLETVLAAANKRFDEQKDELHWEEKARVHYLLGYIEAAYSVLERKYNNLLKK